MKKILSLLLVLLMLFSFAACGDDPNSDTPEGMKLASNTEITDYFLFVPEDWVVTASKGMTMAQASLNDDSNVIVTHFTNPSIPPYESAKVSLLHYFYGINFLQHFFGKDKVHFKQVNENEFDYAPTKGFDTYAIEHKDDPDEGFFARLIGQFDMETDEESGKVKTSFTLLTPPSFQTVKKGEGEVPYLEILYTGKIAGRAIKQKAVLMCDDDYFYVMTFSTSPSMYDYARDAFDAILKNFAFEE